jgi:hypothetical protein
MVTASTEHHDPMATDVVNPSYPVEPLAAEASEHRKPSPVGEISTAGIDPVSGGECFLGLRQVAILLADRPI